LYFHFYCDTLENYTLFEFYSARERDLNIPSVIGTNFIYENGLLISYDRDGSVVQFQYDSLARITQIIFISHVSSDTTYTNYIYDKLGRETDCIVESSNPEADFVGVFVYSSEKRNKVHFRYSDFDKYGNWRKSYFVTEKGNLFRSKREIKYNM
jgi:YD repeat-containing protein